MDENRNYRRHRPGLFGPLVLIAIGVIFLLNNLGIISGDFWENLLRFWPVILIAIGMDNIYKGEGMVGATFMVGLGVVFLLANLGYLALDVWAVIIRLWPILLIAIGFDIMIGRRSVLASFLGMVAILAILLGGIWFFGMRVDQGAIAPGKQISQALQDVDQAEIIIEPGAAELRLAAHTNPELLVSGRIPSGEGKGIHSSYSEEDGKAIFILRGAENTAIAGGGRDSWQWDIGLSPDIPIDLTVGMGVGSSNLNLRDLQLQSLEAKMAIGNMVVRLPKEGEFHGSIGGAIGRVVILVPEGAAVQIRADTGLATVQYPDSFEIDGKAYTSPGFKGTEHQVTLNVNMAIGLVTIKVVK